MSNLFSFIQSRRKVRLLCISRTTPLAWGSLYPLLFGVWIRETTRLFGACKIPIEHWMRLNFRRLYSPILCIVCILRSRILWSSLCLGSPCLLRFDSSLDYWRVLFSRKCYSSILYNITFVETWFICWPPPGTWHGLRSRRFFSLKCSM